MLVCGSVKSVSPVMHPVNERHVEAIEKLKLKNHSFVISLSRDAILGVHDELHGSYPMNPQQKFTK